MRTMPPPETSVAGPLARELGSLPSRKKTITWQELVVPVAVAVTADWVILLAYALGKLVMFALKMTL